jgi:hypothetical protein
MAQASIEQPSLASGLGISSIRRCACPPDVREVGAEDAGALSELPLREAQRLLSLLDREAKPRADVRPGPV